MITTKSAENAMQKYAELMVKTIESMKDGWRKTWFTSTMNNVPENIKGTDYKGINNFFLMLYMLEKGYELPVFITCNQANEKGCKVKKGEKAFPVFFFTRMARKDGEKSISGIDYDSLTSDEREGYHQYYIAKAYNVFNVEQTTMQEDNIELFEKLQKRFQAPAHKTDEGLYVNEALDVLIYNGGWICPIETKEQDKAYFAPSSNRIILPIKAQFNIGGDAYRAGQEFYATAIHEMAHSTASICKREVKGMLGIEDYGREELVAELTAAMMGNQLGFLTAVQKNNAAYMKSWLSSIKKQPKFLLDVLADAVKAKEVISTAYDNATKKLKKAV